MSKSKAAMPEIGDFTILQTQNYLQCSRVTVWRLIKEGTLASYKIRRSVRVRRDSIEDLRNSAA
jgi:excisionase family DNA binding protein